MALVNIQEKWSSINGELSQDDRGILTTTASASRAWTVLFDAAPSSMDAVWATGLPAIGASYPTYTYLKCSSRRAIPLGPRLYEVVCEYAGKDSPLLESYEKSWQEASSTEPIDKDKDGNALVNAAGDPLTGITRDIGDPVYVVTRNEASYPTSSQIAYWNAVNTDTFLGWSAGTARMLPITANRIVNGAFYYYRVTYRIQFRPDGWAIRVLNEGKSYRPTAGAAPVRVKDKLGVDTALLAANGTLLAPGGTPVWLDFDIYPEAAFAPLGLS